MDYSMLGLVFVRFSSPVHRAQTLRFSKQCVLTRRSDGLWCLTCRVANLRKHQLLRPEVRMLLLTFNGSRMPGDASGYSYCHLPVEASGIASGDMLWLGLPTTVTHVIDARSPLAGLSLADLHQRDCELMVLLDGVEATTSGYVQARHSYQPTDIRMNEEFAPVVSRKPSGILNINFAGFDSLMPEDLEAKLSRLSSAPGRLADMAASSPRAGAAVTPAAAALPPLPRHHSSHAAPAHASPMPAAVPARTGELAGHPRGASPLFGPAAFPPVPPGKGSAGRQCELSAPHAQPASPDQRRLQECAVAVQRLVAGDAGCSAATRDAVQRQLAALLQGSSTDQPSHAMTLRA